MRRPSLLLDTTADRALALDANIADLRRFAGGAAPRTAAPVAANPKTAAVVAAFFFLLRLPTCSALITDGTVLLNTVIF